MSDVPIEAQARVLGWVPAEEFRGDQERWVDAETFVEKGKHIMPILQKNNERLQSEVASVRQQHQELQVALRAAQEAIADMQEQHTVQTQRAVDAAKRELKAQLVAASENGDHQGVADLTEQLVEMQKVEAPAPKITVAQPKLPPIPPEFVEWQAANPWYGTDKRRTALADGIGAELRADASLMHLVGKPFWDRVAAEVDAVMSPKEPKAAPVDKVSGARPGGNAGTGTSYSDLPAEAKAACDADLRSKVGEGKRYKTPQEWRNKYAELYFNVKD